MATNLELLELIAPDVIQPGDTVSSILRKLVQWPGGSPGLTDADLDRRLISARGLDIPSASDETLVRILTGSDFDTDVNTTLSNLASGGLNLGTPLAQPVINGATAELNEDAESATLMVSVSRGDNPANTICQVYIGVNGAEPAFVGNGVLVDTDFIFTDEAYPCQEGDEITAKVRFAIGNERSLYSDSITIIPDSAQTVDTEQFTVDSIFDTADEV